MLILIIKFSPRGSTHPNLPSLREGVIYPPCEGGLKVGANCDYQVFLTGCHPSLYLSQNVTFSHLLFGRVLKKGRVQKQHILILNALFCRLLYFFYFLTRISSYVSILLVLPLMYQLKSPLILVLILQFLHQLREAKCTISFLICLDF